jgi:hypothetical protein
MAEATPSYQETVTSNIPEWARKYAEDLLGYGAAITYPKQKIDPKTGKPMFQTDPTTGQPILDKDGKQVPILESGFRPYERPLVADFSDMQKKAMESIGGMKVAPQIGQATGLAGLAGLAAQKAGQYDALKPGDFYKSAFDAEGGLDKYMSPYMQKVVEQQKQQAIQDYSRQLPGIGAAAARAGGRGGTREALLQSEANRNLQGQLGNIQATGLQNAYQQAAQQASQDAQLRAQYGLAGTQLGEQSRQFGAGLGLQGLQQQLAAAGMLGNLGQQQYQQELGINQAQLGAGGQQQNLMQQKLASDYQRFIDEMQYPYKQLEFFSNLLRGTPSSDKTTSIYEPSSTFGMIGGVLGSGGGLGTLFGGGR